MPWSVLADDAPSSYPSAPAKYEYEWQVVDSYSNNNYGQQESRDGANTVGSYFVKLPDGRTQRVSYTVDDYGGKCFKSNIGVTRLKKFSPRPRGKSVIGKMLFFITCCVYKQIFGVQ